MWWFPWWLQRFSRTQMMSFHFLETYKAIIFIFEYFYKKVWRFSLAYSRAGYTQITDLDTRLEDHFLGRLVIRAYLGIPGHTRLENIFGGSSNNVMTSSIFLTSFVTCTTLIYPKIFSGASHPNPQWDLLATLAWQWSSGNWRGKSNPPLTRWKKKNAVIPIRIRMILKLF